MMIIVARNKVQAKSWRRVINPQTLPLVVETEEELRKAIETVKGVCTGLVKLTGWRAGKSEQFLSTLAQFEEDLNNHYQCTAP